MGSAFRINTNIAAQFAQRQLGKANDQLSQAQERLSSGLRINTAADDAAGLAISQKQTAQIQGLNQAGENAQNGISMIQTAEGALGETQSNVQRMRELSVQAANDSLTTSDREQIQEEIDALSDELDRIAETTEFNTKNLLDGSLSGVGQESLEIQDTGNAVEENKLNNLDLGDASDTATGEYQLASSTRATKARLAAGDGSAASGTVGLNDDSKIAINRVDDGGNTDTETVKEFSKVKFTFNSGDTINNAVSDFNDKSGETGVTVSYNSALGEIEFESDSAGSDRGIEFTNADGSFVSDANLTLDTGLSGASPASKVVDPFGNGNITAGSDGTDASVKLKLEADDGTSVVATESRDNYTADGNDITFTSGQLNGVGFQVGPDTSLENDDGFEITGGGGVDTSVSAAEELTSEEVDDLTATDSTSVGEYSFESRTRATKASLTGGDEAAASGTVGLQDNSKIAINRVDDGGNTDTETVKDFSKVKFTFNSGDSINDAVSDFNNKSGETGVTVSYNSGLGTIEFESNEAGSDRGIEFTNAEGSFVSDANLTLDTGLSGASTASKVVDPFGNGNITAGDDGTDAEVKIKLLEDGGDTKTTVADSTADTYDADGNDIDFTSGTLNGLSFDVGPDTNVEEGDDFTVSKQTTEELQFQTGANKGQNISLTVDDAAADRLGFESGDNGFDSTLQNSMETIDVTTQEGAERAIKVADKALQDISTERAQLGAIQNRLETTTSALSVQEENLSAARSRIRDADVAQESVKQTRANILVQAGTSVLSQANQNPQLALQLLGG